MNARFLFQQDCFGVRRGNRVVRLSHEKQVIVIGAGVAAAADVAASVGAAVGAAVTAAVAAGVGLEVQAAIETNINTESTSTASLLVAMDDPPQCYFIETAARKLCLPDRNAGLAFY